MIEDHYAALQAWTEWARNRDRLTPPTAAADRAAHARPSTPAGPDEDESSQETPPAQILGLRAETPHDHAPYSQLFTRLRQSR